MINVNGLSKRYGDYTAVHDVSFQAQPGRVTGFLGPNGAGKSTSMRMIVGLTPATTGTAHILGVPYGQIPNPARRVGVLLDASAQHQGRTGKEVLRLAALLMGLPGSRADAMLERVGLSAKEGKRRVGDYSLGMRQRLGIAHALLGEPSVLILDEPSNGLDPAGIMWMRELLRDFAARGGTVLLSSHLLREVEVVADDLVVIERGKIVAQGRKETLLATSGTYVRALDDAALADALTRARVAFAPAPTGGFTTDGSAEQVGRAAASAAVVLLELREREAKGIEELFLTLTAEGSRDQATASEGQVTR